MRTLQVETRPLNILDVPRTLASFGLAVEPPLRPVGVRTPTQWGHTSRELVDAYRLGVDDEANPQHTYYLLPKETGKPPYLRTRVVPKRDDKEPTYMRLRDLPAHIQERARDVRDRLRRQRRGGNRVVFGDQQ